MSELFVLVLFALINAFFAMSEIALVQSSKPLLKQMAKQGDKRAQLAFNLTENTGRSLSTVQIGMTLVGILAGAYGGATIADQLKPMIASVPFIGQWAGQIALFLVVMLITYLSVVIGELVPKQYALVHPERLALIAAYPMTIIASVGAPIVWILNNSAILILKIMGIDKDSKANMTEDEVQAVLFEGAETGVLEKNEYDMMRRIIALDDRQVKTIMTPRIDIVALDINDDLDTIRQKIHESGHSRFPVIDGNLDNLKGVVSAREVLEAAFSNPTAFNLTPVMKEAPLLSDNAACHKVLELFKNHPVNLAVIIDEYGTLEGIVTSSDLLEAIVGSVASNYEDNQHIIVEREDGSWLVDGLTAVDEVALTIGVDGINHDDNFTTVAGFILHEMGETPNVGDHFNALGYRFEVMDMDGRRIDKVLIEKLPEASEVVESPIESSVEKSTSEE